MGVLATAALIGAQAPATAVPADTEPPPTPRVVLAGISGLVWDDLSPSSTPALWALAESSAVGSLVVRGVFQRTCAADGWLTLGTGARTVAPRVDLPEGGRRCSVLPVPRWDGSTWRVPGWGQLEEENVDRYDPTLGLVSDSVEAAGGCATAVGPGAASMLADASGRVERYESDPAEVDGQLLSTCVLTGIDLGEIPPGPEVEPDPDAVSGAAPTALTRSAALRQLDRSVAALLGDLPPGATFVLVSTADETAVARLRVLTAAGPGPGDTTYATGLMTTRSTRQPGLVTLTDVTDLVLATLDVEPIEPIVGSAPTVVPWPGSLQSLVDRLVELDERAQVIARITFPINQALLLLLVVVYSAFALVGVGRARRRRGQGLPSGTSAGFWQALRAVSLVLASIPVGTYLANTIPWWRAADGPATGAATTIMLVTSVALAVGLVAVALLLPWARATYRPVAIVSGTTVVVLAVDVMTGSHLQFASSLGLSPIAAGRFYGFGNVAFSVFAACSVFLAVALSARWVAAGRRVVASLIVFGFGVVVGLIDGWPAFGADFGGMIALIVGFGLFALLISPRGLSLRGVVLILLAGAAFAVIVSFADYLRPEDSRTHLGDFVASVLGGDSSSTIGRKLAASINSFTFTALAPAIPVLYALFFWVVLRPGRFRATQLIEAYRATPTLQAGLISGLVMAGLGAFVNDSGVIVTGTMLGVGLPLVVAASADPRRRARARAGQDPPVAPPSRSASS